MLSCFQFHLYAGVRAGGGIGDELDPPGDEDFYWRFAFDITFFFFIIVIMLAIIQVKPTFSPLFRRNSRTWRILYDHFLDLWRSIQRA